MTEKRKMPPCLGGYENKDKICDGNPKAKDEGEHAPCLFRDRCVGFQCLLKDLAAAGKPGDAEDYLSVKKVDGEEFAFAKKSGDALELAIDKRIAKYGVKDGKITVPRGRKEKPSKKAPAASKKASAKGAVQESKEPDESADDARELCAWFTSKLQEATGRAVHDLPGDCEAGELFIIDRHEKSNYAAVYARGDVSHKVAVASMYPNRRTGTLQIRVAAPFEAFMKGLSKASRSALEPEDYTGKDGRFRVRISGLDKEGASIVAESVSAAISSGIINLPGIS